MHQYNVGAQFEWIAIYVAGPFSLSDQGNQYLLITMDYFTKWLEAYALPNQEASTVAEALVINFFCCFSIPRELHSEQGHNFESCLLQEILVPRSEQNTHHTPAPTVGRYGGTLHQDSGRASTIGRRVASAGLGQKITPLSYSLQSLNSRHYELNSSLPSVQASTLTALRPAIWGTPRQGMTHNRSCGRLSGLPTRHPRLCPPTHEAGQ
jgi:hypothetical protein